MRTNTKPTEQLTGEPLTDKIYRALQVDLAAGVYEPGTKITISEVAGRFGVSITPVREAIHKLVSVGGLEHRPNYSVIVPKLSKPQILEITLIRCNLEGLAAQKAVENAGPDEAEYFRNLQDAEDVARSQKDYREILRLNQLFHLRISDLADMPIAKEINRNLWTRSGPILTMISRSAVFTTPPDELPHRQFIDALVEGNPEKGKEAMIRDIERGATLALDQAEREGLLSED